MGMDISGGMIIGANAAKVNSAVYHEEDGCELYGTEGNYHEDFYSWYEDVGMSSYSYCYDAGEDDRVVGYTVKDIDPLSPEFEEWVDNVKRKASKFYELTGIKAELIGMQDVW